MLMALLYRRFVHAVGAGRGLSDPGAHSSPRQKGTASEGPQAIYVGGLRGSNP